MRTRQGFASLSLHSNSIVMTSVDGTQLMALNEVEANKSAWMHTIPGQNRVSPDGRWAGVFGGYSTSLEVYRLPGLEPVTTLNHLANIDHCEFAPDGHEVALCSVRGMEFYDTATWTRTRLLTNFNRGVYIYSPDGRGLWLTKALSAAGLFDARTLEPLLLLPTGMLPLAVSPDGRYLAVSVEMQRLQLWNLEALREQLRQWGLDWRDPPQPVTNSNQ
jgi:hypothetical protein